MAASKHMNEKLGSRMDVVVREFPLHQNAAAMVKVKVMVTCEISSTNKADMSWLLNSNTESEDRLSSETVVLEPSLPANTHKSSKMHETERTERELVNIDGRLNEWLRNAPVLYNHAEHAGIPGGGLDALCSSSQPTGKDIGPAQSARRHSLSGVCAEGPAKTPPCPQGVSSLTLSRSVSKDSIQIWSTEGSGSSGAIGDFRRKSWSVSLDESLAIQIYANRPRNAGSKYGSMAEAVRLGDKHGVSPKTIRDIWNRKSWVKVTRAYWTAAEASAYVPRRHRRSCPSDTQRGKGPGKAG
jgi:hypothetical protein